MLGANDLRAFCRPPAGVPVSFNGVSTYPDGQAVCGLFDRPMQVKLADQGFGGVDIAFPELRLPFNAFDPMPTNDDVIVVEGSTYRISDTGTEDDGAFLCFQLELP